MALFEQRYVVVAVVQVVLYTMVDPHCTLLLEKSQQVGNSLPKCRHLFAYVLFPCVFLFFHSRRYIASPSPYFKIIASGSIVTRFTLTFSLFIYLTRINNREIMSIVITRACSLLI